MNWEYCFDPDRKILEVKVKGGLTRPELNAMAQENLAEIKKLECFRCLLNYEETTKGLDVLDIYERPKEIRGLGITNQYRIAILVTSEQFHKYKFVENVYKNNNFDFGVFASRNPAIEFLLK
jgi:hypothetical protein